MESDAQRPTDLANAKKREVCENIITRLRDSCSEALDSVGFVDDLHAHFQRLPLRYVVVYKKYPITLYLVYCCCVFSTKTHMGIDVSSAFVLKSG